MEKGEEMGSLFHQALRSLCFNTPWKYAVFWKLKHRARMILTWEDAYYDNHKQNEGMDSFHDGHYSHDSLELAVARMSYHVYSLGEGTVGQVAVTGKHQWIWADKDVTDSCSAFGYYDEWQTQFPAGIKTIAVVAVVPHGVVQLGSSHKIAEDLKLVNHIKDVFFGLHDSSVGHLPSVIPDSTLDTSTRTSDSGIVHGCLHKLVRADYLMPGAGESTNFCSSTSETALTEEQKQDRVKLVVDRNNFSSNKNNLYHEDGVVSVTEPSSRMPIQKKLNNNFQDGLDHTDMLNTMFRFSAGNELYEALGPPFMKKNTFFSWEEERTKPIIDMPEEMGSTSHLTANPGSEHLLEAVVANVSFGNSVQSLSTAEMMEPDTSDVHNHSSACSIMSSKSLSSSKSHSRCTEEVERPQELAKVNKKRGRQGENCKPRPRDRQLIQDRIKELRELVPSGSKCSIDSLLERTIKHMLFMQTITKHADTLNKCAASKLPDKEIGICGSSGYEHGSSWAMEVGNHQKVYPIKVENIGANGLMMVEMMCEDSSRFLEIAEAIRSLGLTILKGVTEGYGEKTCFCFVVEGKNNVSMHRMDILWSLVQILQSGTKI